VETHTGTASSSLFSQFFRLYFPSRSDGRCASLSSIGPPRVPLFPLRSRNTPDDSPFFSFGGPVDDFHGTTFGRNAPSTT